MNDVKDWSARTRAAQALGRIDEATQGLVPPLRLVTRYENDHNGLDHRSAAS